MLRAQKLAEVADASLAITAAIAALDRLIEDEPLTQPQTVRRLALVKIARALEHQRGQLEGLYS